MYVITCRWRVSCTRFVLVGDDVNDTLLDLVECTETTLDFGRAPVIDAAKEGYKPRKHTLIRKRAISCTNFIKRCQYCCCSCNVYSNSGCSAISAAGFTNEAGTPA